MKKLIWIFCIVFFLGACKKNTIVLTDDTLEEILLQYGKDNPETMVKIETSFGTILLRLYEDTPLHRANFIKLIKDGHYDDGDFYRIVNEFMIQGGDAERQPTYTLPAEFKKHYIHKKGALSMARMDENNPAMRSSAAEFFIIDGSRYTPEDIAYEIKDLGLELTTDQKEIYQSIGGYMSLDQRYTVFGEVIEGLDVVDRIAEQKVFNVDKPLKRIPFKITVE
jgi:cyclophilin family peptidyl-prolyl cis-trans isomerase